MLWFWLGNSEFFFGARAPAEVKDRGGFVGEGCSRVVVCVEDEV